MSNFTEKEALEYLVGLGEAKVEVLDIDGKKFTTNSVYSVNDPLPAPLNVTTLTSLVDYIRNNLDKKSSENLLVHVESPARVIVYSELREDCKRESYIESNALLPDNTVFNDFIGPEHFNIMLQSSFADSKDRALLLKVVGNMQESEIKTVGDDGISQSATIKAGVASVAEVVVPNPVNLSPRRTFPEIEQPESQFVFRMQSGPKAALFEADGGAWRNQAILSIKSYLQEQLQDISNIKIIA